MSVNGRAYDWEDITVTLPHGEAAGITEIKYEDGQHPQVLWPGELRGQRQHGPGQG